MGKRFIMMSYNWIYVFISLPYVYFLCIKLYHKDDNSSMWYNSERVGGYKVSNWEKNVSEVLASVSLALFFYVFLRNYLISLRIWRQFGDIELLISAICFLRDPFFFLSPQIGGVTALPADPIACIMLLWAAR